MAGFEVIVVTKYRKKSFKEIKWWASNCPSWLSAEVAGSEVTMVTKYMKKLFEEKKVLGVEGPRSEDSEVAGFEVTIDKKYGMVRSDNKQQLWEEIIVRDKVVGAERSR